MWHFAPICEVGGDRAGTEGKCRSVIERSKDFARSKHKQRSKSTNKKTNRSVTERSHNFARTQAGQLLRGAKILQEANIKQHEQWMRGTRFLQHSGVNRKPTKIKINHRQRVNEMLVRSVSISLFKSVAKSGNNFAEVARCQPGLLTRSLWVWSDWIEEYFERNWTLPDVQKLKKSSFGKDLAGFQLSLWQQGQLLRRQRGEQSVDRSSEAGDNSIH